MTLLKIARMGHPVLLAEATPVPDPTAREIRALVENMVATMYDAHGVGLAGPQVYSSKRVIIFHAPPERGEAGGDGSETAPLTALINPVFEPIGEEMVDGIEGCLSIPGLSGVVPRYRRIGYRGYAPDGTLIEREASGFHARVVQHEIDHLDGVLYTMRMPDLSLLSFTDELQERLRAAAEDEAGEETADSEGL